MTNAVFFFTLHLGLAIAIQILGVDVMVSWDVFTHSNRRILSPETYDARVLINQGNIHCIAHI